MVYALRGVIVWGWWVVIVVLIRVYSVDTITHSLSVVRICLVCTVIIFCIILLTLLLRVVVGVDALLCCCVCGKYDKNSPFKFSVFVCW